MNRLPWRSAMILCLFAAVGCAKHVASPDLTFETTQRVILTFRGGEQVEGKVAPGKRVELREPGIVWTARVGELSEDRIVLRNLVKVRDTSGVSLQIARAEEARVVATEPVPDKTLLRSEITRVEIVKTDVARTARQASFWAYGAAVLTLLLGDRS